MLQKRHALTTTPQWLAYVDREKVGCGCRDDHSFEVPLEREVRWPVFR